MSSLESLVNVAYVYDGSTEGLLTAIFYTYANHEHPQDIVREGVLQPRLDQSIRFVETDPTLAERVRTGICKRAGMRTWDLILKASVTDEPNTGTLIYELVRLIMSRPAEQNYSLIDDLANPAIEPVFKLAYFVRNECEHMRQFIRFEHFQNGIWFAQCNPRANVVPLIMDWFAARFNTQQFVIYDEVHHVAGIYDGFNWYLAETTELNLPARAPEEALMQAAWKGFYDSVSIPARYHPELRRQFMPKRLWKNILEVRDEAPSPALTNVL